MVRTSSTFCTGIRKANRGVWAPAPHTSARPHGWLGAAAAVAHIWLDVAVHDPHPVAVVQCHYQLLEEPPRLVLPQASRVLVDVLDEVAICSRRAGAKALWPLAAWQGVAVPGLGGCSRPWARRRARDRRLPGTYSRTMQQKGGAEKQHLNCTTWACSSLWWLSISRTRVLALVRFLRRVGTMARREAVHVQAGARGAVGELRDVARAGPTCSL